MLNIKVNAKMTIIVSKHFGLNTDNDALNQKYDDKYKIFLQNKKNQHTFKIFFLKTIFSEVFMKERCPMFLCVRVHY